MRAQTLLTAAVPVLCAAAFARLGVWQLNRLAERRAYNRLLERRLVQPPVDLTTLGRDTATGHYRRVHATGRFVYDREITWAPRTRDGSPGVNLLTPFRIAGSDTLVLVDRGWVYSADAKTVEHARWQEGDSADVAGYVETWSQPCPDSGAACKDPHTRTLRRLNRAAVESLVGNPVAPYLLMQTSDSVPRADSVPVRIGLPVLDEGPHESYAIQWFAFAAIAIAGGSLLVIRSRRGPA